MAAAIGRFQFCPGQLSHNDKIFFLQSFAFCSIKSIHYVPTSFTPLFTSPPLFHLHLKLYITTCIPIIINNKVVAGECPFIKHFPNIIIWHIKHLLLVKATITWNTIRISSTLLAVVLDSSCNACVIAMFSPFI